MEGLNMTKIMQFIGKNWEPIIAISGLVLSIFNFFILNKNNRKSISIKELFYLVININGTYTYEFNLIIVNKSKQPISIVDVSFENKGNVYSAKPDRTIVSTKKSNGTTISYYSSEFPINLAGLESTKELLQFKLKNKLDTEILNLKIMTSRGIVNKKVSFENKKITTEEYLKQLL